MAMIKVSELAIYPVKSMAQVTLNYSRVDRCGLAYDRRWMVVDSSGKFITQRQYPHMCLIQAQLQNDGLLLNAAGMPELTITKPSEEKRTVVTLWNDQCQALDAGDAPAKWLSEFLSVDCRLVAFPDNEIRQVDPAYAQPGDRTAFSDGFPILLISQASLDDLNSRMATPLPMARFRPNLVVSGCDAYAEDNWQCLRIGGLTLRVVKPCSRCVIPSIDTATGERGVEPTRTLASYRKRDNKIYFGQNVIAEMPGELRIDMPVEILA